MFRRAIVAAVLGAGVLGVVTPAFAHVTVQPGEATQGGFATVAFQVPNERDDASTVQLEVTFPADHPIPFVSTQPVEGWTVQVDKAPLDTPISGEGEDITEAVSKITWSGGSIAPGTFQRFPVSLGPLPETASLEFKSVQTYSDGEVVRWIDSVTPGGEEPERPAPTLTLVAATDDDADAAPTARGVARRRRDLERRRLRQDDRHHRCRARWARPDRRGGRYRSPPEGRATAAVVAVRNPGSPPKRPRVHAPFLFRSGHHSPEPEHAGAEAQLEALHLLLAPAADARDEQAIMFVPALGHDAAASHRPLAAPDRLGTGLLQLLEQHRRGPGEAFCLREAERPVRLLGHRSALRRALAHPDEVAVLAIAGADEQQAERARQVRRDGEQLPPPPVMWSSMAIMAVPLQMLALNCSKSA